MSDTMNDIPKYSRWEDIPANLKTKTAIKQQGLKLRRNQKPIAIKTSSYHKTPDYDLYDVGEAVPNIVSDKQKAALAKAQAESLKKRTCTRCGYVEELSRDYRSKHRVSGGYCEYCWEDIEHESDKLEAVQWASEILKRDDVLILDTETTNLDGEIIELAMINLAGETVFNRRFNPLTPISEGAKAIHGITMEAVANEPFFVEEYETVSKLLTGASVVLIYNAAFDTARIRTTCKLQNLNPPKFNTDCIMTWYAQYCGEWSDYHGNYKWQSLDGGHSALGDCLAALACLAEMAKEPITDNPHSEG